MSDRFSPEFETFLQACRDHNHDLIIPSTTAMEFKRKQADLVLGQRTRLTTAGSTLDKYGIKHDAFDSEQIIREPDLMRMIQARRVRVVLEEPTLEDFREAHKRACLHEPPQPPKTENDEMRDLVIWQIAIRIAVARGGALLVSRDKIHAGELGDAEAQDRNLTRVQSLEAALECFQVGTPAGALMTRLITTVWDDLVGGRVPVSTTPSIVAVTNPSFVQGKGGPVSAKAVVKARSNTNRPLAAKVMLEGADGRFTRALISDLTVDDKVVGSGQVIVSLSRAMPDWQDDFEERLRQLRGLES